MRWLAPWLCVCLAACSNLASYEAESYIVRSGDTLYSIAWRHGLDHRDLARWNNLANPDRLAVGQRLVLAPGASRTATPPRVSSPRRVEPPPSRRGVSQAVSAAAQPPEFGWPTRGALAARFGDRGVLTTGIGIAGRRGQDVVAAAPGRVVYAGSGLVDYGQLVIVEHNQSWLTAYGHSENVLVSQGQSVVRGQKIGEMGIGPEREPQLYFEIRRDGSPLDPLAFLPPLD